MFGLRFTNEIHARSKNGRPAQNTTGVERMSPTQFTSPTRDMPNRPPISMSAIVSTKTGAASAAAIQNRRVMSTSSGFGPASRVMTIGSSAMPQRGQGPGASRTTSGSMGQVYCTVSPSPTTGGGATAG